jgi:ribosomal protein S18 acetylase RimI-like enzyme
MEVSARPAVLADIPELVRLYGRLIEEMVALKAVWALTEGLPEPLENAFEAAITAGDAWVSVGMLDGAPVGFLLGRSEALLPQAGGERVAAVRLIYTEPEAREVGIGEALMNGFLEERRAEGYRYFDAHVSPGHRLAKNFFESNGFKARHIVMHHEDGA